MSGSNCESRAATLCCSDGLATLSRCSQHIWGKPYENSLLGDCDWDEVGMALG